MEKGSGPLVRTKSSTCPDVWRLITHRATMTADGRIRRGQMEVADEPSDNIAERCGRGAAHSLKTLKTPTLT